MCFFSVLKPKQLVGGVRTNIGLNMAKSAAQTSELLASSLPDFCHNSSEETDESDSFEAPSAKSSK